MKNWLDKYSDDVSKAQTGENIDRYNIDVRRTNMIDYVPYYENVPDTEFDEKSVERAKREAERYNAYVERKYGPQNEYRSPKSAEKAAERFKQLRSEFSVTPNYQMGGSIYPVNYVPEAQMGGSIPGSVGFTYARTNSPAPSNGKYAKKTMASAQDGKKTPKLDTTKLDFSIPKSTGYAWADEKLKKQKKALDEFKKVKTKVDTEVKKIQKKHDIPESTAREVYKRQQDLSEQPIEEVRQYTPQSTLSKVKEIALNPMTAAGYKVRNEDIPENFSRSEDTRNNLDTAVDFINPVWYAESAKNLVQNQGQVFSDLSEGNFQDAALNQTMAGVEALNFIPLAKGAKPLLNKGMQQLRNIPTSISPELRQGVNTNGFLDMFKSKKPITTSVENLAQPTVFKPWEIQELPGLHLKSTMEGEAISRIVEPKTGLVNVEQALGIIGKESGGADKVALIKQGLGETLPKKMDYNEFRKVVQDQLIPLERQFSTQSSGYGINNLGYNKGWKGQFAGENVEILDTMPLENQTLILGNKNKFGRGSSAHGNPDETLGHIHFLRDAETPDVLTVTQIQSDAFQGTHRIMPKNTSNATALERQQYSLQRMEELQERNKSILNKMKTEGVDDAGLPVQDYQIKQFEDIVKAQEQSNLFKKADIENFTQKQLLDKNHQERYLQELVDYAGKRGDLNKVRVPTSETAAKVQGYRPVSELNKSEEFIKLRTDIVDALEKYGNNSMQYKKANEVYEQAVKNSKHSYSSEHQTILKKYSEQPKTIKKLFGTEPQIVTDGKGNTWYEFDIPKKFKQGKGEIKAFSSVGAIGTAGVLSQTEEEPVPGMKQGGVIKDDRGQWAHPGEITKIAQEGKEITVDEGDGKKRKILTDSREYSDLYNEGRIGVKNDDESISVNPLSEVVITPYDKQYPFYQELSDEEKKYFNSDTPIGRQIRSKAQDNVGFNAEKAENFAMGWLRDLPLASLQAPQSALVEGIEGIRGNEFNMLNALEPDKQRIPSETWGIENPYAAFAVDAFTDPETLMGMSLLKNPLQKGLKQLGNIKTSVAPELRQELRTAGPSFTSSANNVTNISKNLEDLNYAKKWAKQYGYELPKNLERIAQSDELTNRTVRGMMNRHNTFVRGVSTNWDELAKRNPDILKNLEERGINWKDNPEEAAKLMLTEIPPDTGYGRYMMNKGENALYTSNSIPTAQGYTYGDGYYAKLRRKNLDYSSNNRQDWINNNQLDYQKGINNPEGANIIKTDWQKRFPTSIEEFVKSAGNPNLLDNLMNKVDLKVKNKKSIIDKELDKHIDVRKNIYNKAAEEMKKIYPDKTFHHNDYFDIRDSFITNADKKALDFTAKKIDKFRAFDPIKYEENQAIKEIFTTPEFYKSSFRNLIKPDKFGHYAFKGNPGEQIFDIVDLKKMTPELWQNKSRAHIGKYSKKLSAMEEGGVIKDDMGYWNPDNWGEVVEIDSNDITMKGVYEPLIGISDTGDTKLMQPGKDYKFKGKKVTEYPLAKDGKELVKLNQLTNFTNYNKPTVGGWLDKY